MSTLAQPVDVDTLLDQVDREIAARGEQDNVAARLVQRLGVTVGGSAMAMTDSCHQ